MKIVHLILSFNKDLKKLLSSALLMLKNVTKAKLQN